MDKTRAMAVVDKYDVVKSYPKVFGFLSRKSLNILVDWKPIENMRKNRKLQIPPALK